MEDTLFNDFISGFPPYTHQIDLGRCAKYAVYAIRNGNSFDLRKEELRNRLEGDICEEIVDKYQSYFEWTREVITAINEIDEVNIR